MIEDKIGELFYTAYKNGKIYEYLVGKGDYKVTFKDSATYDYNDIELMERGINAYLTKNPNINIDLYLNQSLIELLNSNDVWKVSTVLDFVVYYVKYRKKEKIKFSIDIDKILPLLKEKIQLLKEVMIQTKIGHNNDGNFWEYVEKCRRKEYAPFVDTLDYLK